jgi:hypothetical protein
MDKSVGCFEFWLNRYQTLFTGLAALCAAWIASLPVRKQLQEMSRQSAASARAGLVDQASALENERDALSDVDTLRRLSFLVRDYDEMDWHTLHRDWSARLASISEWLWQRHASVSAIDARNPGSGDLQQARRRALDKLNNLIGALSGLDEAFREQTSGPDYQNGESDLTEDERSSRRTNFDRAFEEFESSRIRLAVELQRAIQLVWTRIRALETYAVGALRQ